MEKIKFFFSVYGPEMQKNNRGHSKKMSSISDQIPKKKPQNEWQFSLGGTKSDKPAHCAPFPRSMGMRITYNMTQCKKWDKIGILKKTSKSEVKSSETSPGANERCTEFFADYQKLNTSCKKSKKGS